MPDLSVREALQRIDETERRTVYVTDPDRRLLGSVTDGDIRRWLLAGGGLAATLKDLINPEPTVVHEGFDRERLKDQLIEIGATCVPLVDGGRRVLDLIFWEDVFAEVTGGPPVPQIGAPVVIMAGGRGARMAPFTQVLPKPLLPVGERTVIELIIEPFVRHGVRRFFLTTSYKANLLKAYFQELPRGYEIEFVEEAQPLGTAGGLGLLADRLDTAFIVTNCDIVIQADYHDLLTQHLEQENDITMVVSLKKYSIPYGVCEIEQGGRLRTINEKPTFDLMVNTGMYVLSPGVLRHVRSDRTFHMTELIALAGAEGERVGVYPIGESAWLDTGEWAEYKRTLQQFESRLQL
jgi:dTDP-glucose pyrophosphorylase